MNRRLLRREEAAGSPLVYALIVGVIIIGLILVFILPGLITEKNCEGFQEWFEIIDHLDPDKVMVDPLKSAPEIPEGVDPLGPMSLQLLSSGQGIKVYLYLWSGYMILKTVFNMGCELSGHSATIYQNDSQSAVVDVIIGLILGVESEGTEDFFFVPTQYTLSVNTSGNTTSNENLGKGDVVQGLDDFPPVMNGLPLNRTINVIDRR